MIGPGGDLAAPVAALVVALAAYRLTALLVYDEGPWAVLRRLRELAGVRYYDDGSVLTVHRPLAGVFACAACMGVWMAPLALALWWAVPLAAVCVALAGATMLLDALGRR